MTRPGAAHEVFLDVPVPEDPVHFYEHAPCGFVSTTPDGLIVECNATFRAMIGRDAAEITGRLTFAQLLTPGGRIYHETHYAPMLRMHDSVREIALELVRADGERLPVLVNATLDRDDEGLPRLVRVAVFDATQRRRYERELLRARERAEVSERRARALAMTLQQTLIPPTPPDIPYLDVAAAYRPAGAGDEVGGDFYDVFRLGDDDWVVALGDVCGKGASAAVVTAMVRHTLRDLFIAAVEPSQVLAQLNAAMCQQDGDRFVTLLLVRLRRDADGWYAVLALGGHPPPVLVRAGAEPQAVRASGPLIGIFESPAYSDETVRLAPGDALVLYTDGVTEGRRQGEFYGERRLLASVARNAPAATDIVEGLLAEVVAFQEGDTQDDVAVLALAVPPADPSG